MKVEVIREGQFRGDDRLNQIILSLMSDVYEDPKVPMEEETTLSDTLYLIWDENHDLQFFHFVKWHEIEIDGESTPALYSAWMGAKETIRTDGSRFGVFRHLLADMLRWQQENGKKLIYWGTTATLAVYLLCLRNLVNTRLNLDGSYSESDEQIARACQRWLGAQSNHPFALHGLTKARYRHR